MPKNSEKKISQKEIRELWWEYLKRSDKFKEFCNNRHELGRDYFGDCYWPFIDYLRHFGNIFEQEFEDWWSSPRRKRWQSVGTYPVLDLRNPNSYHGLYFESLRNSDKELKKDKIPSPKKIFEIITTEPRYIFLAVPVVGQEDMKNIAAQIKEIRDSYKKTAAVKEADKKVRKFPLPSTRIRDELKRYLDVYDFSHQGLKMRAVMKEVAKKHNIKATADENEFYHDHIKAKKIIKNVEKGVFPGDY